MSYRTTSLNDRMMKNSYVFAKYLLVLISHFTANALLSRTIRVKLTVLEILMTNEHALKYELLIILIIDVVNYFCNMFDKVQPTQTSDLTLEMFFKIEIDPEHDHKSIRYSRKKEKVLGK